LAEYRKKNGKSLASATKILPEQKVLELKVANTSISIESLSYINAGFPFFFAGLAGFTLKRFGFSTGCNFDTSLNRLSVLLKAVEKSMSTESLSSGVIF